MTAKEIACFEKSPEPRLVVDRWTAIIALEICGRGQGQDDFGIDEMQSTHCTQGAAILLVCPAIC